MIKYAVTLCPFAKTPSDAKEWGVCNHYDIDRSKHDSGAYDRDSDVNSGDKHISVKSAKFTLMSGSLCEGRDTFEGIWELYAERVHSNVFAYVCNDGTTYEMDKAEFCLFVHLFCKLERESEKNGGAMKIRCKSESKALLKWLADMAA